MNWVKLILSTILCGAWMFSLATNEYLPLSMGDFLNPFSGFWANAEPQDPTSRRKSIRLNGDGLLQPVKVLIDDRGVPHIKAQNTHDLYYAQGYVTAIDRLWQMEFQTLVAAGRISEIMGENPAIQKLDIKNRRIGLLYGAEQTIVKISDDPEVEKMIEAYTMGINARIENLNPGELPLPFKILNYKPEKWTPLKTALLLKFMSWDLTGRTRDYQETLSREMMGSADFKLLFPDHPLDDSPIISSSDWTASQKVPRQPKNNWTGIEGFDPETPDVHPNNGSNNWAIGPQKSKSGNPILCSDPHLKLRLPSIWYELQMTAPGINVYGVSLPGSPCVIIGFNEDIAWGVTNAARDVLDWYKIKFKDETRSEYWHEGEWLTTKKRIEEIKIKDKESIYDTLIFTHHGPVHFDKKDTDGNPLGLAMRWTAHDTSGEIKTFQLLNWAKNHKDYKEALKYYDCPGQNFVFASKKGDIAIQQQGKFVNKWKDQGKFILDGTRKDHDWQSFIPFEDQPHELNPDRHFVSSANQNPTSDSYPYLTPGSYEYHRNRRLNSLLGDSILFGPGEMMAIQNDNFNLEAADYLPFLLDRLFPETIAQHQESVTLLNSWGYQMNPEEEAPVLYDNWVGNLETLIWEDDTKFFPGIEIPKRYNTLSAIKLDSNLKYIDNRSTAPKESLMDLINLSFQRAVAASETNGKRIKWADEKKTHIDFLAPLIKPFAKQGIRNGGSGNCLNATTSTHGPSWRMIVEMGEEPKAWGVLPGGASENPGSPFYSNQLKNWENGEYYNLLFIKGDKIPEEIIQEITLSN